MLASEELQKAWMHSCAHSHGTSIQVFRDASSARAVGGLTWQQHTQGKKLLDNAMKQCKTVMFQPKIIFIKLQHAHSILSSNKKLLLQLALS